MKILHVISSGGMYGAEAVILDLSRALRRMGHTSEIGLFENSASLNMDLATRARAEGIRTHAIPCAGQLDLSLPARLRQLAHRESFDVLHTHGYKGDVYAFWAMHAIDLPLVATCHNWIEGDLALRIYGGLDRFALKRFSGVAAVSQDVQQRLIGAGVRSDRTRLIRNGVDLRALASITRDRAMLAGQSLTIGIVARLSPEKGVDIFLRAASLIAQHTPQARFLVAGDGPERGSLEALIAELHLEGRAVLLGRQEDMPGFYAKLDLLVLSSRTEGLPMALLESMASGLPVVATRVGEVPQVVQDGETGHIVPVGDATAIADAVIRMTSDPELLRHMGSRAQAYVAAHFSADRMAAEYLEFYKGVLRPAASGKNES